MEESDDGFPRALRKKTVPRNLAPERKKKVAMLVTKAKRDNRSRSRTTSTTNKKKKKKK